MMLLLPSASVFVTNVCMYVGMCVCMCLILSSSLCGIVQAEDNVEEIIQTSNSGI